MDDRRQRPGHDDQGSLRGLKGRAPKVAALAVAVLLWRWIPGDAFPGAEIVAYLPALLPGVVACIALALCEWPQTLRAIAICFAAGIFFVALVQEQPNLFRIPRRAAAAAEPHARIALYNVRSYRSGVNNIATHLAAESPDIIGLLEGTTNGRPPDTLVAQLGEEYRWVSTRRLSVASRLPIKEATRVRTDTELAIFRVEIKVHEQWAALWLVDVPSPGLRDSAELFAELEALLATERLPWIAIGDMNAPRHSAALHATFARYTDISARAPNAPRWLATWPSYLPLWQIDHAYCSKEFQPVAAHFAGARASDHRALVVEVAKGR